MFDIVPFMMGKAPDAPLVMMSATLTPREVSLLTREWSLQAPSTIRTCPVQQQHTLINILRPPSRNKFRGYHSKDGAFHPGLLQTCLDPLFLDYYCDSYTRGVPPTGATIIFCWKKELCGQIWRVVRDRLPTIDHSPSKSPFVIIHGDTDECSQWDIIQRKGFGITLYLTTNCKF